MQKTNSRGLNLSAIFILLCFVSTVQGICDSNCLTCLATTCFQCRSGTSLFQGSCNPCLISRCVNCLMNVNQCTQCYSGRGLPNCLPCNRTGCSQCASSYLNSCTKCVSLAYQLINGYCIQCLSSNCNDCSADRNICTNCFSTYGKYASGSNVLCKKCSDLKCLDCQSSNNISICNQCLNGFGVQESICVPCFDTNCLICQYNFTDCTYCRIGYGVKNGAYCVPCDDTNCLKCWQNSSICEQCAAFYGIKNNGCVPCKDLNCNNCRYDYLYCYYCKPDFGLDASRICQPCVNCLTCLNTNMLSCTSCPHKQYLSSQRCHSCISNCQICNNGTVCIQCVSGYYLETNLTCKQICGDYNTTDYPCDNELNQPYDGCTNDCQVMPDFSCVVVNFTTACTYIGPIEILITKILRSDSRNAFTLFLQMKPLLHILKTHNLSQILNLQHPLITVQQIRFDVSTNMIMIQSAFNENIIDPIFNLSLYQSQGYNISLISNFSLELVQQDGQKSLYFYYDIFFKFYSVIRAACWAILALGWIAAIVDAFLRKLAGLEALFVLQISFFLILCSNPPLKFLFTVLMPFRYSTGFNPKLIQNSQANASYFLSPFKTEYPITQMFMVNNFNIGLIAMLVSCIVSIIMKIRLSKSENTLKNKKKNEKPEQLDETVRQKLAEDPKQRIKMENLHKQQQKEQWNRINSSYEKSLQCFFFISLINLTLWIGMSVLFVIKAGFSGVINFVVIGCAGLVFGAVVIWFLRDTFSFEMFSQSFRSGLAKKYYIINFFYLIAVTTLIIALPSYKYAPIIPTVLHLIFVFFYKPYIQRCENYRQCFNLLVICYWCSICFLCLTFTDFVICLLLICGGLALIVFIQIWAIASAVYYFRYGDDIGMNQSDQGVANKMEMKVLNDLKNLDTRKQISSIPKNNSFAKMGPSNQSLMKVSNKMTQSEQLKNNQTPQQQGQQLEPSSIRQISPESKKPLNKTPYKSKKQIQKQKQQMKSNGIIYGFDETRKEGQCSTSRYDFGK